MSILCPVCGNETEPAAQIGTVAVCGSCGMALHVAEDGAVRRATVAETGALTEDQRLTLRRARRRG